MFFRQLVSAACLLVLVTSTCKASDVRAASFPPDGRTVNAPRMSDLAPEQLMQAVRHDLESAVQNHEALADSLPRKSPASNPDGSYTGADSFRASMVDVPAGWDPLSSSSNPQVMAWEFYFSGPGSARLRASLLRLGPYREHLEGMLRERGLPPEMMAVAFVESEFVPSAVSPKGATGLWQFMPVTASRYGLELKPFQDDRTDLEKSTSAAAQYLTDLHERFGDWLLALAAYNAGEDLVESAVARGRTRDFWRLSRLGLLPPETREYVPKVLGAARAWKTIQPSLSAIGRPKQALATPTDRQTWTYALSPGD